jgi:hypothetical protein
MIRDNLKVAQSRQKSYVETRRRELSFKVGDYIYFKVSPMRSVKRFNLFGLAITEVCWTFEDYREMWNVEK